jgi:hypothetical protein
LANWRYYGYIVFSPQAVEGLRKHLKGQTEKDFKELLCRFVIQEGGRIDQVIENREECRDQWEHHYDLRPIVNGIRLYVETRLLRLFFALPDVRRALGLSGKNPQLGTSVDLSSSVLGQN